MLYESDTSAATSTSCCSILRRICECDVDGTAADYLVGLGASDAALAALGRATAGVGDSTATGWTKCTAEAVGLLAAFADGFESVAAVCDDACVVEPCRVPSLVFVHMVSRGRQSQVP